MAVGFCPVGFCPSGFFVPVGLCPFPTEIREMSWLGGRKLVLSGHTHTHRNDITTLALYGHGSETILCFSMGHGKVIHFPIIIRFYKHFL